MSRSHPNGPFRLFEGESSLIIQGETLEEIREKLDEKTGMRLDPPSIDLGGDEW